MNTKTIIASLGLLGLSCTAQAAQNPWAYYWPNQKQESYSGRYDSTFGGSIKGMYAWASEEVAPDLGGGLIDIHANIASGSVFHELSLNSGVLYGSENYLALFEDGSIRDLKFSLTSVPLMFGYTFNAPMSDTATFYLGGKIGATFISGSLKTGGYKMTENSTEFSFSVVAGFKIAINEKANLVVGYELYKMATDMRPYHGITAGISWSF